MKILINAIPMTGLLTGIARYLRNLYGAMDRINETRISYFNGKTSLPSMPPLADPGTWQQSTKTIRAFPDPIVFGMRAAHWLKYEHSLNKLCKKKPFQLYHETAFTPAKISKIPTIFSIYDLSLRRHSKTHPRERVWLFEHFIKTRLRYASHILTISEFIRQEIIEELNVPASQVSAIHLAPDPLFSKCSPEETARIQSKYDLPSTYLLFVSSLEPRKNIDLLIDAMEKADTDIPLVLVGWQGWGEKHWLDKLNKINMKNRVYLIGHVPDNDLKVIYNSAQSLVYPSLYEGFGLPILEAMACGCPVICSNTASMPEVAGNAAIFIDPSSSDDLAQAIETMTYNTKLRKSLVTRGTTRAKEFNWEKTATKTLDVFKMVKL
ncbi:alpha-1,3-rhamnosyl/mannosyltransferase [Desulfocicer vacuolatum DSM 3385]|uniref:Alpha-1,3-rhamnosyl/mannosyltransferase n=1 Tax=Desulfocicer vacuolatum DSM 3385 TaxID=1121400 RepID=A0A1W2BV59_9BACT|nr:glycosyltransferase family 1 protein [Desulfocicer vacuolatum]SMC76624.1 alpha-1,3-rhamnosyl/mannosyltransferase [Desulfocicer vacuolatum DSM 3385]